MSQPNPLEAVERLEAALRAAPKRETAPRVSREALDMAISALRTQAEALERAEADLAQIAMHKALSWPATPHVLASMAERNLDFIRDAITRAALTPEVKP